MSWRDNGVGADPALEALQSMPVSTPKRLYVTTGQHDTPPNDFEFDQQLRMRERWFARFLKGDPEPIEDGPLVRSAALPADAATYTDPTSLWRHRADDSLPPQSSTLSRLFLREGGALSAQAPTTSEPPQRVVHRMPPGYTAQQWAQSGGGTTLAPTLSVTPLSEHVYTSEPFAEPFEIAGLPTLELALTPMHPRFFVAARLDLIPPNGGAVTVGRGAAGERQSGVPSPTTLSIGLDLLDTVVPAGARLQLRVRNHYIVNTSQGEYFHTMPYLSDYDVDVEHSPGALSFVDLPLRQDIELDLTTAATELSVSAPAAVDFGLQSAPAWASTIYFVLMSLSGQGPGLPLPGGDRRTRSSPRRCFPASSGSSTPMAPRALPCSSSPWRRCQPSSSAPICTSPRWLSSVPTSVPAHPSPSSSSPDGTGSSGPSQYGPARTAPNDEPADGTDPADRLSRANSPFARSEELVRQDALSLQVLDLL
ncbi:MAG: CocE/NonD family hydrolase C-terminal non-catalytic domain-containing protein [Planctomycetota bacterium]|jgi:hypothetical protein